MKRSLASIVVLLFLVCCRQPSKPEPAAPLAPVEKDSSFFPVTNYLQGQIAEIRQSHTNPLKKVTRGTQVDSSWVKMEMLEQEFRPFLEPRIDSTNLLDFFSQTSFMDQTLDAVTFTYEPTSQLPDSFPLKHWDVYINPHKGIVKRIYMVKETRDGQVEQLTWVSGEYCKIVILRTNKDGSTAIESEQLFTWNY